MQSVSWVQAAAYREVCVCVCVRREAVAEPTNEKDTQSN